MKIVHRGLLRMARLDTDRSRYRSTGYLLLLLYANRSTNKNQTFLRSRESKPARDITLRFVYRGTSLGKTFPLLNQEISSRPIIATELEVFSRRGGMLR